MSKERSLNYCNISRGGQVRQDNRLDQRRLLSTMVIKRQGLIDGIAPFVVRRVAGIDGQ